MRIQLDTQASHTGAVAANAAVAAEVTEAAAPAAATAVASAVAATTTTTAAAEVHANRDTPKQTCQKRSQCAEPLCKHVTKKEGQTNRGTSPQNPPYDRAAATIWTHRPFCNIAADSRNTTHAYTHIIATTALPRHLWITSK